MGHCRDNPSKLIWKYHFERKREIWRIVSYRSIRGRLASAQRQTKRCSCGRVNDAGHSSLRLSGQCCPLSAADGRSATKLKPRKSRSKPRPLHVTSRPSLQTSGPPESPWRPIPFEPATFSTHTLNSGSNSFSSYSL